MLLATMAVNYVFIINLEISKPFKSYIGEGSVNNFLNRMLEKINIVVIWWKNILTKNLRWLKKMKRILRTLLNVGFVTMFMMMVMLK